MQIDSSLSAIVTGGASGLGRATVEALRATGAKVAIFDLNEALGEEVAAATGATFVKVNIMDEASAVAGFAAARAANGQERALVHCAMASKGGKTLSWDKENGRYKRLSSEDYSFSVEGILTASYRMASLSALGMVSLDPINADGERGAIVLTASAAAQDGQVGQVAYGSGKAGVNGLVLPMARDLMDVGIRVNSIMPGIFATPPMLAIRDRAPAIWEGLNASVPFPKRLGAPPEFGSLVLEILRNGYMNAQTLRLDGGIRMPPR
jgi:NAD(P)-dependent dehydrogenase (short-subunit alcohol dehydrogenase family)